MSNFYAKAKITPEFGLCEAAVPVLVGILGHLRINRRCT